MPKQSQLVLGLIIFLSTTTLMLEAKASNLHTTTPEPVKPGYLKRALTSASERQALLELCAQFQQAIREKNGKLLASLLLHDQIVFTSPASPERSRSIQAQINPHFNGLTPNGALEFIRFIADSKVSVDEKFYDIHIHQDKHLAWINFDFEFMENGKVVNYGQEHWQVLKTSAGEWKIFSVIWSSYGAPPAQTQP